MRHCSRWMWCQQFFDSLIIILIAHFRMHMLSLVKISSLEYADDAGLLDVNIQEPSTRVTKIATGSRNDAAMFHPNFEILVSYCSYCRPSIWLASFAWFVLLFLYVYFLILDYYLSPLRGRVARKFNDKPNWNRGKDARFLLTTWFTWPEQSFWLDSFQSLTGF